MYKLFLIISIWGTAAHARYYDLYRADYTKGAFCSLIGGACASDDDFDGGFFQNPASLTASGPNWDFDFDYVQGDNLEPGMKRANTANQSTFMGAFAFSKKTWGAGISLSSKIDNVTAVASFSDDAGYPALFNAKTNATTYLLNLPVAVKIGPTVNVGVTATALMQKNNLAVNGSSDLTSFTSQQKFPAMGLTAGFLFQYSNELRFGGWLRSPITAYYQQHVVAGSPTTTFDYTEDFALNEPWSAALGVSYLPWGKGKTILFDLNVVGNTPDGYLLSYDNFASALVDNRLTRKGRSLVVDPRLGFRAPLGLIPKSKILVGTYYENSRWDGVQGLFHFTGGLSFVASIFGHLEFLAGADLAKNYLSLFFTFR